MWLDSTTATLLPAIAGGFAEAYGLNDSGWIVGASTTTTAKESSIKYQVSSISTFTDHSQLTTQASTIPTAAVLWLNHTPINLNSVLLNGAGWTLIEARDVNNRGQIIGYGKLNGQLKTFLLTPQNSAPLGKEDIVMDMSQPINLLVNDIDADGDLLKVLTVRGTNMDKVAWTESGEFRFLAPPSGNETYFYIVTDQNGASIDTAIRYNPNVANDTEDLPTETALLQNYPNPFERETTIPYHLSEANEVSLVLFDGLGRQQFEVDLGIQSAGRYEHKLEIPNLPNGMYYYQLKVGNRNYQQRFVVLR